MAALAVALVVGCPTAEPQDDDDAPQALETRELTAALAAQWAAEDPPEDHPWDWMDAVYMLGFVEAHRITSDPEQLDYPARWIEEYYGELVNGERDPDASDRVAPNILPVQHMTLSGADSYPAVLEVVDEYLASVPRSDDGGILHWGTHFPDKRELLIDSLFMFGGYLVSAYALTGDEAYLDLFVEQLSIFESLCRHDEAGLFVHAWDDDDKQNIPDEPIYWARGNGWIVAVTSWYLAWAPSDHGGRELVLDVYRGQVDAWIEVQDDGGLFHTVLNHPDDPDNYLETSASALFLHGTARGIHAGVLPPDDYRDAVVAAHDGVVSRIVEDGDGRLTVEGTSFGTMPTTYDNYIGIPLVDDLPMGVGTVLMGLAAADGI
jgi:unsaturated rhamnogalacturonyl hydrolase